MSNRILSVILPVFNGMPYLRDAIQSLLNQSFQDFVIIVIDNGSNDATGKYIQSLKNDKIEYHKLKEKNLVKALNTGLKIAKSPFIARMDADDVVHPRRFENQINFFNSYKDISLIGTCGYYLSKNGRRKIKINCPLNHIDIIKSMLNSRYAIIHPSIMMKKDVFDQFGGYKEEFSDCEDFEFFLRIGGKIKFANLPEHLYYLRIRDGSIMMKDAKTRTEQYYSVSQKYCTNYNVSNNNETNKIIKISFMQKLDTLSIAIYRKGLNYFLNVNFLGGIIYFIAASILNPLRLMSSLKKRFITK
jgi:glycosyltransferase involved in cell wall biosynthesis